MRRAALTVLLVFAGCARTEPPADPAGLTRRRAQVGGDAVTLLVPPGAQVAATGGQAVVRLAPTSRSAPTIRLSAQADPRDGFSHRARLAGRARLYYDISTDPVAGSGGDMGRLRGRLETVDGLTLGVECEDQREVPHPTWCVAYLYHVHPANGSGPGNVLPGPPDASSR